MISLRYLFSRKRKRFISFMSFISILGVAVGVACLITVLAVMNGFGYELQKRIVGSNPHVVVEKEHGINLNDSKALSHKIADIAHVKGSYPFIRGQGVLKHNSRAQGVVIRSLDTSNVTDLSKVSRYIIAGSAKPKEGGIIIGSELSIMLGAFLGDKLSVITPSSNKIKTLKVTGIFSSGMYEYDLNLAYVDLASSAKLFGMDKRINGIGIDIDDIRNAADVKAQLKKVLAPSYYVRTWQEMNRSLFSALKLEKWAMFVILTLIIIVAALNIVSTLTVMVTQKAKDIGILKAIGATKKVVMVVFSMQGVIIGGLGAIFGAIGGMGLSFLLKEYHFISLPKDIYYISEIPVKINITDSLIIIASAVLISFLASIYPAYQASRLNPADALRYE